MLSFVDYLSEVLDIPNRDDHLHKMRHGMPQIDDVGSFVKALEARGISVSFTIFSPKDLKPMQKNFKGEKIDSMVKSGAWDAPIFVSADHRVIDGHHRWAAAHKAGGSIRAYQVDLTAENCLKMCEKLGVKKWKPRMDA